MMKCSLFLLLLIVTLCACTLADTATTAMTATPTVQATLVPDGTETNPVYVEDTEAGSCIFWHIAVKGGSPLAGCAEHMQDARVGSFILLSSGEHNHYSEYQVAAMNMGQYRVSVTFVQKWIPDGSFQHPYLLLVYSGSCPIWKITFIGIAMEPLCTSMMPFQQTGQYLQLAGAGQHGELTVESINRLQHLVVVAA